MALSSFFFILTSKQTPITSVSQFPQHCVIISAKKKILRVNVGCHPRPYFSRVRQAVFLSLSLSLIGNEIKFKNCLFPGRTATRRGGRNGVNGLSVVWVVPIVTH